MKYDAIKKFVSAVLSAVIVTSTVPISTNASSINTSSRIIGDLDGDFRITSADALLILRASVNLENLDKVGFKLADVDDDGTVTSADALDVLRYSVSLPIGSNVGKN